MQGDNSVLMNKKGLLIKKGIGTRPFLRKLDRSFDLASESSEKSEDLNDSIENSIFEQRRGRRLNRNNSGFLNKSFEFLSLVCLDDDNESEGTCGRCTVRSDHNNRAKSLEHNSRVRLKSDRRVLVPCQEKRGPTFFDNLYESITDYFATKEADCSGSPKSRPLTREKEVTYRNLREETYRNTRNDETFMHICAESSQNIPDESSKNPTEESLRNSQEESLKKVEDEEPEEGSLINSQEIIPKETEECSRRCSQECSSKRSVKSCRVKKSSEESRNRSPENSERDDGEVLPKGAEENENEDIGDNRENPMSEEQSKEKDIDNTYLDSGPPNYSQASVYYCEEEGNTEQNDRYSSTHSREVICMCNPLTANSKSEELKNCSDSVKVEPMTNKETTAVADGNNTPKWSTKTLKGSEGSALHQFAQLCEESPTNSVQDTREKKLSKKVFFCDKPPPESMDDSVPAIKVEIMINTGCENCDPKKGSVTNETNDPCAGKNERELTEYKIVPGNPETGNEDHDDLHVKIHVQTFEESVSDNEDEKAPSEGSPKELNVENFFQKDELEDKEDTTELYRPCYCKKPDPSADKCPVTENTAQSQTLNKEPDPDDCTPNPICNCLKQENFSGSFGSRYSDKQLIQNINTDFDQEVFLKEKDCSENIDKPDACDENSSPVLLKKESDCEVFSCESLNGRKCSAACSLDAAQVETDKAPEDLECEMDSCGIIDNEKKEVQSPERNEDSSIPNYEAKSGPLSCDMKTCGLVTENRCEVALAYDTLNKYMVDGSPCREKGKMPENQETASKLTEPESPKNERVYSKYEKINDNIASPHQNIATREEEPENNQVNKIYTVPEEDIDQKERENLASPPGIDSINYVNDANSREPEYVEESRVSPEKETEERNSRKNSGRTSKKEESPDQPTETKESKNSNTTAEQFEDYEKESKGAVRRSSRRSFPEIEKREKNVDERTLTGSLKGTSTNQTRFSEETHFSRKTKTDESFKKVDSPRKSSPNNSIKSSNSLNKQKVARVSDQVKSVDSPLKQNSIHSSSLKEQNSEKSKVDSEKKSTETKLNDMEVNVNHRDPTFDDREYSLKEKENALRELDYSFKGSNDNLPLNYDTDKNMEHEIIKSGGSLKSLRFQDELGPPINDIKQEPSPLEGASIKSPKSDIFSMESPKSESKKSHSLKSAPIHSLSQKSHNSLPSDVIRKVSDNVMEDLVEVDEEECPKQEHPLKRSSLKNTGSDKTSLKKETLFTSSILPITRALEEIPSYVTEPPRKSVAEKVTKGDVQHKSEQTEILFEKSDREKLMLANCPAPCYCDTSHKITIESEEESKIGLWQWAVRMCRQIFGATPTLPEFEDFNPSVKEPVSTMFSASVDNSAHFQRAVEPSSNNSESMTRNNTEKRFKKMLIDVRLMEEGSRPDLDCTNLPLSELIPLMMDYLTTKGAIVDVKAIDSFKITLNTPAVNQILKDESNKMDVLNTTEPQSTQFQSDTQYMTVRDNLQSVTETMSEENSFNADKRSDIAEHIKDENSFRDIEREVS